MKFGTLNKLKLVPNLPPIPPILLRPPPQKKIRATQLRMTTTPRLNDLCMTTTHGLTDLCRPVHDDALARLVCSWQLHQDWLTCAWRCTSWADLCMTTKLGLTDLCMTTKLRLTDLCMTMHWLGWSVHDNYTKTDWPVHDDTLAGLTCAWQLH